MRTLLSFFGLLFFISCKKSNQDSPCTAAVTVVGKWQAYEQFRSPGAGGSWYPLVDNERFEVTFKADGSFSYSSNFPAAFFYDSFIDNTSGVTVTASATGKSATWAYSLQGGCSLSLNVFTCFEGCAYRLKRIQ
jgi:hypothetical protein